MRKSELLFFKQKTAYEMRISDWSSDVCSSDLRHLGLIIRREPWRARAGERGVAQMPAPARVHRRDQLHARGEGDVRIGARDTDHAGLQRLAQRIERAALEFGQFVEEQHPQMRQADLARRSEEHTSELQSLMRISYAVFCL